MTIKGYKAFNKKDMTCRGFRFEEGKSYFHNLNPKMCESGFHFCEDPLDCLDYYDLTDAEFAEVQTLPGAKVVMHQSDSKIVTTKLKIVRKLGLKGFIEASVTSLLIKCKPSGDVSSLAASGIRSSLAASGIRSSLAASGYVSSLAASGIRSSLAASGDGSSLAASGYGSKLAASGHVSNLAASGYGSKLAASGYDSKLAASGDGSSLAASGDSSKLAASGYDSKLAASGIRSSLAASGYGSSLAASGYGSKLAASGDGSKLELTGKNSVSANIGIDGTIKGKIGNWITLAEWEGVQGNWIPVCVKSARIDGIKIKEDVWYSLKNGAFTEAY